MNGPLYALMIADDLTGALDSSVFFAERAWSVTVRDWQQLSSNDRPWDAATPTLLAIDSDSRNLQPDVAAARIATILATVSPLPPGCLVFKKIDSRVKGNVEAETEALANGLGRSSLLVCPAVPDAGRLVEDGMLIDGGTVTALPGWHGGLSASYPDVRSDAELSQVGRDFLEGAASAIAVGSRGLARSLAEALPSGTTRSVEEAARFGLPMAFIIGTNDPITLAQVAELRRSTGVPEILFPRDEASDVPPAPCLLLRLAVSSRQEFHEQLRPFVHWAGRLTARLAARTLVVSGGDTLRALADARQWTGITPLRSLGQGLVLGRQSGGGPPLIVSKSGGFGHLHALSELAQLAHRISAEQR